MMYYLPIVQVWSAFIPAHVASVSVDGAHEHIAPESLLHNERSRVALALQQLLVEKTERPHVLTLPRVIEPRTVDQLIQELILSRYGGEAALFRGQF